MDITVKNADWAYDKGNIKAIRQQVFINEQHVPEDMEWDQHDDSALHCLVFSDDQAVATARLQKDGQLGRMAVLKTFRGKGIGRLVINHMLELHHAQLSTDIFIHAQKHATGFYNQFGFVRQGSEFIEAGIAHYKMVLNKK